MADTEKNTFRNVGKGSLVNIEPNLSSIGDAKVVAKSMHHVFGLFDPHRFEIQSYPNNEGYRIDVMRGNFKSLIHLKTNESEIAPRFGMYFDGKHEIFKQMPMIEEKEELDRIYTKIIDEEKMKRAYAQQKIW